MRYTITKWLFRFSFAVILIQMALADAATIHFDTAQGRHMFEVFSQDDQWIVDEFLIEDQKLQEFVGRKTFLTQNQADNFIDIKKKSAKTIKSKFTITLEESAPTEIWKATNSWNQDWEDKYSKWVEENFDAEFFTKYNIATDCADAAYAIRWIFSRINKLPAAGTLAGTGVILHHANGKSEWAKLPTHEIWHQDQRFLKALDYLLDNVYTTTLYEDGFPLEIQSKTIRPGTIILLGGHTQIMSKIIDDGTRIPITILSSTVPRQVRTLSEETFTMSSPVAADYGGLIQFRHLMKQQNKWLLIPKDQMPFYSLEQYEPNLCEDTTLFALCIFKKLGLLFDPYKAMDSMLESLMSLIKQRMGIVTQGHAICSTEDCSPGSMNWEDWSTPSRDKRLLETYSNNYATIESLGNIDFDILEKWILKVKESQLDPSFGKFSLYDYIHRAKLNLVSSDPRDPIETRWANTIDGAALGVENYYQRLNVTRNQLIKDAEMCRKNRSSCEPNSENYKKFNTTEIDLKIREKVSGYGQFCLEESCPEKLNPKIYYSVWFKSPHPWDDLALREGTKRSYLTEPFIFYENSIEESDSFLVINGKKLFDLKTKTFRNVPAEANLKILSQSLNKPIIAQTSDAISIWDQGEFKILYQRVSSENMGIFIHTLGKNHIVINEVRNDGTDIIVFNLISHLPIWSALNSSLSINPATNDPSSLLIYNYNENEMTLFSENDSGLFINFTHPKIPQPTYFLGKIKDRWMFRISKVPEEDTLYIFNAEKVEVLKNISSTLYPDYFSNVMFYYNYEINRMDVYDQMFNRFDTIITDYPFITQTNQIDYMTIGKENEATYLWFNKSSFEKKLEIPENFSVISAGSDWISVYDQNTKNVRTTNHRFQDLLPPSKTQFRSLCRTEKDQFECLTKNRSLGFIKYASPENALQNVSDFGMFADLNSNSKPWAYVINDISETSLTTNQDDGSSNVEDGVLLKPLDNVLIYFPKSENEPQE